MECLCDFWEAPGLAAVFRKALSDESKHIRSSALSTLTCVEIRLPELVPDLIRLLDEDPDDAAEALGLLGEAAKRALPKLREKRTDPEARLPAALAILGIADDEQPLFEVVRKSVAEGKPQGIDELGKLYERGRPLVPEVIRALEHENRWIRKSAAVALGNIGGERALDALLQRLAVESDKQVLIKINLALGRLARVTGRG